MGKGNMVILKDIEKLRLHEALRLASCWIWRQEPQITDNACLVPLGYGRTIHWIEGIKIENALHNL